MNRLFAPGCGLMLYKPHLAEKLHRFLDKEFGHCPMFLTCCHHIPPLPEGTEMINVCPGCDRRYRENYTESTTVSVWELLAGSGTFPFPDHGGAEMSIIDACPTRDQTRVHDAVRAVLAKMNIKIIEPKHTRTQSTCCGDSFYGQIPKERVITMMKKKASEMPGGEVAVYCISCSKSMFIGSKKPRYMIDLIFGEETVPKTTDPDKWHEELDDFINSHK
jgi:Fe-S oxidoreductase